MLQRSDRTLSFNVWSEDVSASGRVKKTKAKLSGLWLCPVMIPEELDLSRIDRMLGGSVRSLPPERPVSGMRAVSGLFSWFLFHPAGNPLITESSHALLIYSTAPANPSATVPTLAHLAVTTLL